MRDLMNSVHPLRAIAPAAATADNTPWVGVVIDRDGFESVTYLIVTGVEGDADATFTVLLEHGDAADGSGMTPVPDAALLGTEALAGFTFADDNETRKLGYVGAKRFTRLTITPANNAGNAFVSAIALLGHPANSPTPNPPV